MRNNHDDGEFRGPMFMERVRFWPDIQTLTGTYTIGANQAPVQHLDPGGSARTVLLPPESKGLMFLIRNAADAAEALTIKEDANVTTIAVLAQDQQAWIYSDGVTWYAFVGLQGSESLVGAVAAGYRIARGQHTTVAASDTVVTGLTTVTSVVASLDDDPVDGAMHVSASIGDQAGTPAAGSVLIKTWKSTDADATLIAATTFTKKVNWIAVGV